jgi:WD40 repeat protein
VGNDGTIRIWNLPDLGVVNVSRWNDHVLCVLFHPSRKWLALAGDDVEITMWSST